MRIVGVLKALGDYNILLKKHFFDYDPRDIP